VNGQWMSSKQNYIQDYHARFQDELKRTGKSEPLNWRSKLEGKEIPRYRFCKDREFR